MAPHDTSISRTAESVDSRNHDKDGDLKISSTDLDVKPRSDSIAQEPTQAGWFHWHEPGTSKEEKKLIFKLDWFLLSFSCLTFFLKQVGSN
jgi:ACS family pantothenate transporter-like MFS transporter